MRCERHPHRPIPLSVLREGRSSARERTARPPGKTTSNAREYRRGSHFTAVGKDPCGQQTTGSLRVRERAGRLPVRLHAYPHPGLRRKRTHLCHNAGPQLGTAWRSAPRFIPNPQDPHRFGPRPDAPRASTSPHAPRVEPQAFHSPLPWVGQPRSTAVSPRSPRAAQPTALCLRS
jgi:hypothetical protein